MSKRLKLLLTIAGLITLSGLAFLFANYLKTNGELAALIESTGILGTIIVALIAGLNPVLPVPPATFAPAFNAAGLSIPLIITGYVIGTVIADSVGYFLARFGSPYLSSNYPKVASRVNHFLDNHNRLVIPFIWFYSAFVPLPNELMLVPLGLARYDYRKLLLPIILGNIFHHTILVLGYQQVFRLLFG